MAKNIAEWGNKTFLVSPSMIVPMKNLSTGFARKSDSNDDTSGTAATNTRGMELQTIKMETTYLAGVGVDPRTELESWKNQFGVYHPLLINGKQFGPDLLELDSIEFSNILTDNVGRFLQVDATITLIEYVPPKKTVNSATTDSKKAATAAKPTTTEKSQKKTTTNRG